MARHRSYDDPCGVARSLNVIGERWALLIVRELLFGPKRFNDLLTGLSGASPNVVSQRLHELARWDVLRRRDLGPPANVHVYELTEWGRELEPVLFQLGHWGARIPPPAGGQQSLDSLMLSVAAVATSTRAATVDASYRLRIGNDEFTIDVHAGAVQVRRGATDRPDATLTTNANTLRAVCTGRKSLAHARSTSELTLDGNHAATDRLTELVLAPFTHDLTAN